jgi:paired amphipathic helix protein Sin3a
VQILFKDAPDLLEEFKDFLPEVLSNQLPPSNLVGAISQQNGSWNPPPDTQQVEKPAKSVNRRKKRVADKEVPPKAAPSRVRCEMYHDLRLFA